jgi:hypothetical protein
MWHAWAVTEIIYSGGQRRAITTQHPLPCVEFPHLYHLKRVHELNLNIRLELIARIVCCGRTRAAIVKMSTQIELPGYNLAL